MILLNIKSSVWAYSLITLGTEMLNSIFSFYYVKFFLEVYQISEVAFYQGQLYVGTGELEENLLTEHEQDLAWAASVLMLRQILSQKNFYLFLIMNFFQLFNDFMMIFADHLIPRGVLSSSLRGIMYGVGFICPQYLVLLGQSWLKRYGYYNIILISFYLEGAASNVMLLLGQEYYYCLALYLTVIMVIVQASFCLFNLPLADMVNADLLKFNRQPLFSIIFGINALFAKPAQSLAPMVILFKVNQYGYGEPSRRQSTKIFAVRQANSPFHINH
uniref:uncharacterized protein LOC101594153 n=1 Tax=Jaculus jaculus TaxID=51337 RepID=UPI001E1B212A|nr:uncharacterized protein LOC101594153 [Jaculus jaculus]